MSLDITTQKFLTNLISLLFYPEMPPLLKIWLLKLIKIGQQRIFDLLLLIIVFFLSYSKNQLTLLIFMMHKQGTGYERIFFQLFEHLSSPVEFQLPAWVMKQKTMSYTFIKRSIHACLFVFFLYSFIKKCFLFVSYLRYLNRKLFVVLFSWCLPFFPIHDISCTHILVDALPNCYSKLAVILWFDTCLFCQLLINEVMRLFPIYHGSEISVKGTPWPWILASFKVCLCMREPFIIFPDL